MKNKHSFMEFMWCDRFMQLCVTFDKEISCYTLSEKNPCDYVFDDNLNSKRPIVIIFCTVIT